MSSGSFGLGNPYGDPNWYDGTYHSAYYKETHKAWRKRCRDFVEEHIIPYVSQWEVTQKRWKSLFVVCRNVRDKIFKSSKNSFWASNRVVCSLDHDVTHNRSGANNLESYKSSKENKVTKTLIVFPFIFVCFHECSPCASEVNKAVPKETYIQCAEAGLLPIVVGAQSGAFDLVPYDAPEDLDYFHELIFVDELARLGEQATHSWVSKGGASSWRCLDFSAKSARLYPVVRMMEDGNYLKWHWFAILCFAKNRAG